MIEAKDNDDKRFLDEAVDLLFPVLYGAVAAKGFSLEDVKQVLQARHINNFQQLISCIPSISRFPNFWSFMFFPNILPWMKP